MVVEFKILPCEILNKQLKNFNILQYFSISQCFVKCFITNMDSESLLLTYEEHVIVAKYKRHLESKYSTKIEIPHIEKALYSKNDIIFAFITGAPTGIREVKDFLKVKISYEREKDQSVVILSENETDEISISQSKNASQSQKVHPKECQPKECNQNKQINTNLHNSDVENSVIVLSDSDSEISSTAHSQVAPVIETEIPKRKKRSKKEKRYWARSGRAAETLIPSPRSTSNNSDSPINQEVSSTTYDVDIVPAEKRIKLSHQSDNSLTLNSKKKDYWWLSVEKKFQQSSNQSHDDSIEIIHSVPTPHDDSIIIIDSDTENSSGNRSKNIVSTALAPKRGAVPRPINERYLRPIVIDGSNVARAHGMVTNTYSGRGIQISIEYFLKRGHKSVTCFVPNFRRTNRPRPNPTTNHEIIQQLALQQFVVFTPNKSYDDRFILDLASQNQGVILSNDNYRDLKFENALYQKVVDERLLQYCFVGDIIMIPGDPRGRSGPKLDEFLSFPPGYVPTM